MLSRIKKGAKKESQLLRCLAAANVFKLVKKAVVL